MGKSWQMWKLRVYRQRTGETLAEGSFKECAEKLGMTVENLRRAEWEMRVHKRKNQKGWAFERVNVQNRYRMIDCSTGRVIDEGTAKELSFRQGVDYDSIIQVVMHKKRGRIPKLYDYERIE